MTQNENLKRKINLHQNMVILDNWITQCDPKNINDLFADQSQFSSFNSTPQISPRIKPKLNKITSRTFDNSRVEADGPKQISKIIKKIEKFVSPRQKLASLIEPFEINPTS